MICNQLNSIAPLYYMHNKNCIIQFYLFSYSFIGKLIQLQKPIENHGETPIQTRHQDQKPKFVYFFLLLH